MTKSTFGAAVAVICAALAGCQTANRFADNTTTYNLQAEQTIDRALLLNVVRASKRRPLIFADLQTITGANPVSGSLAIGIPASQNGGHTALTTSPTVSLSAGPSASVAVVNTQDFYDGMLKPIPMSTIDLFVQRGISRDFLFNLFISSVTFSKPAVGNQSAFTFEVRNYPEDEHETHLYQSVIEALLDEHMTTSPGPKSDPTEYGPPLLASELAKKDGIASALTAGMTVEEEGWCDLDDDQQADFLVRLGVVLTADDRSALKTNCDAVTAAVDDGGQATDAENRVRAILLRTRLPVTFYQYEKAPASPAPVFCYDRPRSSDSSDDKTSYCSTVERASNPHGSSRKRREYTFTMGDQPALCKLINAAAGESGQSIDCKKVTITFAMRSTYSVIYYLGELARADQRPGALIEARTSNSLDKEARRDCFDRPAASAPEVISWGEPACAPIFAVSKSASRPDVFLSVQYDGDWYSIDKAPGLSDKTYEMMDLVVELIALNRSAKDLPTSSVVTLVGAP